MKSEPRAWVHKAKCTTCGLHFAAYSWHKDWKVMHCPECGGDRFLVFTPEESNKEIFQDIPGHQSLAAMT